MKRTTRFVVAIGVVAFLGFTSVSATLDAASPDSSSKKTTTVSPKKATTASPKKATVVQSILQEEELARLLNTAEQTAQVQSSALKRLATESTPVTYFDPFQLTRKSVAVLTPGATENQPSTATAPVTAGARMALVAATDGEGAPSGTRVPYRPRTRSPFRPSR